MREEREKKGKEEWEKGRAGPWVEYKREGWWYCIDVTTYERNVVLTQPRMHVRLLLRNYLDSEKWWETFKHITKTFETLSAYSVTCSLHSKSASVPPLSPNIVLEVRLATNFDNEDKVSPQLIQYHFFLPIPMYKLLILHLSFAF